MGATWPKLLGTEHTGLMLFSPFDLQILKELKHGEEVTSVVLQSPKARNSVFAGYKAGN